jgi:hypothetical protein
VRLEGSTKPHVHRKYEIFWTNIASTMAYPNIKIGPQNGLGPLGVKNYAFDPPPTSTKRITMFIVHKYFTTLGEW